METLVFVEQHKNQYYSTWSKPHGHARFGSSSSPSSRDFRGYNCRTFQSGAGILPSPLKSLSSPKTPTSTTPANSNFGNRTPLKTSPKSTPIAIKDKTCGKEKTFVEDVNGNGESLWAGPTYSNSPPPSSLPIPKFSVVRPKRTVSLELPGSCPEIEMRLVAKSAPSSPTRKHSHSTTRDLFDDENVDSATKTLCRILNLNINDDDE